MTLPKDPQKREEYLEKQRRATKARMANPEWKAYYLQQQNEGIKKPEVIAKMQKAQQWRRDNPENAEKYEADKEARRQALRKPEVRKKNSQAQKERMARPGEKERVSALTKEAMNRPDVQTKVSEGHKRSWQDPIARENYIQGQARRWERPEEHENHSNLTKEAMQREDVRERYLAGISTEEYHLAMINPENIARRTEGIRRSYENPERRQRLKEVMEEVRKRDSYKQALAAGLAASKRYSGTDIELIIDDLLAGLGLEYETQKRIKYWVVDFYVPGKNLIIECDGDYWHSLEEVKARDMRKNEVFKNEGYKVVRLLGSQIYAEEFEALFNSLDLEQ